MKSFVRTALTSLLDFAYPKLCIYCESIIHRDQHLCFDCISKYRSINNFGDTQHDIYYRILLRKDIDWGSALFTFTKTGIIQKMIHSIKYRGRRDIAEQWGKDFGRLYKETFNNDMAHIIIPIPVHNKRQKKRGYNQSEEFAKGISFITGIPIFSDVLIKQAHHKTLTQQTRESRFTSVKKSFKLINTHKVLGKKILLIDDVITTGATIEAAIDKFADNNIKIAQVGFMAISKN